jgi:hypothetical protein
MPEDKEEDSFVKLILANPGKALTIAAAILAFGVWMAHAETQHRQIPQIVQGLDKILKQKEADLEAKKQVREAIVKMCIDGTIKDKAKCAKVGVILQ